MGKKQVSTNINVSHFSRALHSHNESNNIFKKDMYQDLTAALIVTHGDSRQHIVSKPHYI